MAECATGRPVILAVDDDALVREALQRQLRRAGYAMVAAESGQKALAFAGIGVAELVILDLRMPGMDGFETCRRLKAMQGWEHVPVLILTGDQDGMDYAAAVEAGADDFLTKPVLFQELMLRIHSLLRVRRLVADLRESVATIEAQGEVILREKAKRERLQSFLLHDLKNPVASILLLAEMKIDTLDSAPPDGSAWGQVLHHAERMMQMITGWMDFSRSEDIGLNPKPSKVETRALLDALLKRHALWFQVQKLVAEVRCAPDVQELYVDPILMERVLGNLVENCIRHSPEGGRILLEAKAVEGFRSRIEVSDQGPGVAPDLRESIFDMYVQLEAASQKSPGRDHRGLGLAFCRMAVEAHGGRIWVEDNPGGGARFVIEMPSRV